MAVGSHFFGGSISGFPETVVSLAAVVLDGAILRLAFLSPVGLTHSIEFAGVRALRSRPAE